MRTQSPVEQALQASELRAAFLRYTREAYALLPALERPRILDLGCGSGSATIELARLSEGQIVGIDTDASALAELQRRIDEEDLGDRVRALNASLFDVAWADQSFDLLWEEGVLHLLDPAQSLPACQRLLEPAGFFVMHETVAWFEGVRDHLGTIGLGIFNQLLLPGRCWWTDYYAPLEARIRAFRKEHGDVESAELAQHEREIAMVKADPDRFDCGFFVLHRSRDSARSS
ncbi:MAG: class I SAM-dependent methyltransferase [Deltaproteobacteria bacterium]|nr:class I SAM-dependent methyltransferase [Deltaproteobacteria bacterium]